MTYNKASAVYANLNDVRTTQLVATPSAINDPEKIFIDENILLIGEKDKGIHVFDNSNPNSPINISFINIPFCSEFYVKDNIVYAETHYDLVKIDINDIHNPNLINRIENCFYTPIKNDKGEVLVGFDYKTTTETIELNSPKEIALRNSSQLFFDYQDNLIPESSVPSSFVGNNGDSKGTLNKIALLNDYLYVVGSSKLYTFDNSSSSINFVSDNYVGSEIETIYPENNKLFLGTKTSMIVLDPSNNPENPSTEGRYDHPTSCDPVLPNGNTAYLTLRTADYTGCSGDKNELHILDISNVQNPVVLDNITMDSPYGMNLINNYLFVGEGINGLTVFDASNPQNLVEVAHIADEVYDIIAHPTNPNIILTTNENGLQQYSIDYSTMSIQLLSRVDY